MLDFFSGLFGPKDSSITRVSLDAPVTRDEMLARHQQRKEREIRQMRRMERQFFS